MAERDKKPTKPRGVVATFQSMREFVDIVSFFLEKSIRKHGLTPSQFYILKTIKDSGPNCQKRLGELLVHTGGNVTVVSKLLEKRKLIKRTRNTRDRRMFTVTLTGLGETALGAAETDYRKTLEGMMSLMSPQEIEAVGSISSRMFEQLAAERVKIIRSYRPPEKDKRKKR